MYSFVHRIFLNVLVTGVQWHKNADKTSDSPSVCGVCWWDGYCRMPIKASSDPQGSSAAASVCLLVKPSIMDQQADVTTLVVLIGMNYLLAMAMYWPSCPTSTHCPRQLNERDPSTPSSLTNWQTSIQYKEQVQLIQLQVHIQVLQSQVTTRK